MTFPYIREAGEVGLMQRKSPSSGGMAFANSLLPAPAQGVAAALGLVPTGSTGTTRPGAGALPRAAGCLLEEMTSREQ